MIRPSTFLRRVLLLDAVSTTAAGVLMLAAAGAAEPLLRLPADLVRYSGASFLPFAAAVGYAATRTLLPRGAVWAVIAYNALWAAASILVLLSGFVRPAPLGYAFVIAQAAFVAVMAELEYFGLRRSEETADA